jgi:hypothetical protein
MECTLFLGCAGSGGVGTSTDDDGTTTEDEGETTTEGGYGY